ncbi:SapC family protein [Alteromonas halophila]|uniref:Multidrug transporter n=1 Tax=Alteromonas halophila TaxID=516698 RepID=A0A918JHI0_9ALTE|nr:SapC family protein [Alteromonas halophila]GGW81060.1 hypothetical protein GCM10007391_12710 [Alteromonas halophila]
MTSPNYVVLNAQRHHALSLISDPGFRHAEKSQIAALVFQEIVAVASCMPVVVLAPDSDKPALSALFGLTANTNLFAGESWQGHVVPMSVQVAPFNYAVEDQRLLTLIDEKSPLWQASGQRLFSADHAPTPLLKQRQTLLKELASGAPRAEQFIKTLSDQQLLKPLTVRITDIDGQSNELTGMFTVDETCLGNLSAETLKQLHDNGMLTAIHAMLLSLRQFNRLVQLARQKGQPVQSVQLS